MSIDYIILSLVLALAQNFLSKKISIFCELQRRIDRGILMIDNSKKDNVLLHCVSQIVPDHVQGLRVSPLTTKTALRQQLVIAFCSIVGEGSLKIGVITSVRLTLPTTILYLEGNIDFGFKETKEGELIKIRKQKKSPRLKAPNTLNE